MASDRMTIRIDPKLRRRIRERAWGDGKSESDVVRQALHEYVRNTKKSESAYDIALRIGLIGSVKNAPPDLSTNKKYFKDFGK